LVRARRDYHNCCCDNTTLVGIYQRFGFDNLGEIFREFNRLSIVVLEIQRCIMGTTDVDHAFPGKHKAQYEQA
jgi:hypothetical protein